MKKMIMTLLFVLSIIVVFGQKEIKIKTFKNKTVFNVIAITDTTGKYVNFSTGVAGNFYTKHIKKSKIEYIKINGKYVYYEGVYINEMVYDTINFHDSINIFSAGDYLIASGKKRNTNITITVLGFALGTGLTFVFPPLGIAILAGTTITNIVLAVKSNNDLKRAGEVINKK